MLLQGLMMLAGAALGFLVFKHLGLMDHEKYVDSETEEDEEIKVQTPPMPRRSMRKRGKIVELPEDMKVPDDLISES